MEAKNNMTEQTKEAKSSTEEKDVTKTSQFRILLLALMILQNSSVVLIGRHTRSATNKEDLYEIPHFIIVAEFVKFMMSCVLENYVTNGNLIGSIKEYIIDRPLDFLQVLVPSLLYLVQNSLLYVALSNLSAPLFQVTYQTKLLTTALVSVVLLQRRYTPKQWVCLTTLGVGVAIVVLGEKSANTDIDTSQQSLSIGLISVTVACMSSALAGVYLEMVLKNKNVITTGPIAKKPSSLWMRNIQMAFFSMAIALVNNYFSLTGKPADHNLSTRPFMHGFNSWVYLLVLLQAGGGLLVAAIIKYADNVMKGLATGIAVCFTALLSTVLFHTPLTMNFVCGASVILVSVFFFSNSGLSGKKAIEKQDVCEDDDVEMKQLLVTAKGGN